MTNNLEDAVRRIIVGMDNQESQDNTQPPEEEIQDVYVLIVREQEEVAENTQVVDSTSAHVPTQQDSFLSAYVFVCFSLFLIVSTLALQLYCMLNPPVATITIIPKSQIVTLTGTLQLGRVLNPITISQSQTAATTGHGHQLAAQATGFITLYNGQFQSVFIAAGTILTGASGVQIITDQDASIPAASPPIFGYVSVPAHAVSPGVKGNIPAYDIHQACCATSVLAKNVQPFYGGQDERTYTTVTQKDIHSVSTVLKTTLAQSLAGAFQGQLKPDEQLHLLPCSPTVTSDHQPGDEATKVNVTVSQTCSAIVYNSQELAEKTTALLTSHAQQKTGAGYSLFGTIQVSVKQASVTSTLHPLVFLSFSASGRWIYGISHQAQQQIKHLIEGKTRFDVMHLLASLPGVERALISFNGFGDATRLPKQSGYIHIILIVV